MTYKVSVASNSYTVKQKSPTISNYKVVAILGSGTVVTNLADLGDVNTSGIQNGYVLIYNSSTGEFVGVDPDVVLSNAATSGTPGLPTEFVDKLDVDLDDKIDLDAGGF